MPVLPIHEVQDPIVAALRAGSRLVLTAPPGSGKTTQVPQILFRAMSNREGEAPAEPETDVAPAIANAQTDKTHKLDRPSPQPSPGGRGGRNTEPRDPSRLGGSLALPLGKIIVLQPRRLATRMVAARVASEMRTPVGELVGYQTRHDSKVSRNCRIIFLTEGLFLRWMLGNPALPGVAAVVLDEFHERSLAADTILGLLRSLQESRRPDLRLVVMSATLDARMIADFLDCPVIEAGGRMYPVDVRYLPSRSKTPVWDLAAEKVRDILDTTDEGHVLVFMSGAYEINRTLDACRRFAGGATGGATGGGAVQLCALHGSLPPAQQDAAVAPCSPGTRKIIVATNIAETSITIDGVRHVIDSGLAKVHRYDPRRGINVLLSEPISRASAEQRAGRAGRTAPGTCIRLWPQNEHATRDDHDDPEILRLDLAEVVLQLKAMGVDDVRGFPWLQAPDEFALTRGEELLVMLHALSDSPPFQGGAGGG